MATNEVFLASPRGFCAGVTRAIGIVERVLELYSAPVYVLHEIVHNPRVVEDFRAKGVVFVEALSAVPAGRVAVFSAHGVSRAAEDEARSRGLVVIDATCPLVTKVHLEVVRHSRAGRDVVMVGHRGHPEVSGTLGRCDGRAGATAYLVESVDDAARLVVRDPARVAVVTQTTLSIDDTARILAVLRSRFPGIVEPRDDDICYATQNRQNAVRRLAGHVGLLIVVGGRNSSNSNRLQELGVQLGVPAHLVQHAGEIDAAWLADGVAVGLTAGASTPDALVAAALARLHDLGWTNVRELPGEREPVTFRLPVEALRRKAAA